MTKIINFKIVDGKPDAPLYGGATKAPAFGALAVHGRQLLQFQPDSHLSSCGQCHWNGSHCAGIPCGGGYWSEDVRFEDVPK